MSTEPEFQSQNLANELDYAEEKLGVLLIKLPEAAKWIGGLREVLKRPEADRTAEEQQNLRKAYRQLLQAKQIFLHGNKKQ
jgi:hypothetical protein